MFIPEKIDHIGIAVRDLNESMKTYSLIGCNASKPEEVPAMGVRVAFIPVGDTRIELLEPISKESVVAKFIEKRGEGIHHICFLVKDIYAAIKYLKEKNFRLIYDQPKAGSENSLVTFVHPESIYGILLEFRQQAIFPRRGK